MARLKSRLLGLNRNRPENEMRKVYSPANCELLRLPIRTEKTAKVVGKLAERLAPLHKTVDLDRPSANDEGDEKRKRPDEDDQLVSGVLVQNDLKLSLMAPEDLREYAGLTTTTITCRQKITLASASIELIRWALEGTFGGITDLTPAHSSNTSGMDGAQTNGDEAGKGEKQEEADEELPHPSTQEHKFLVMDTVTVTYRAQGAMELEWEGNMMNDGIADAVMAVLLGVESSPAAVRQSSRLHGHGHHHHGHAEDHADDHAEEDGEGEGEPKMNGTSNQDSKAHDAALENAALNLPTRPKNPHANLTPAQKLSRLMLFLESQFGADAVTPIAHPKLSSSGIPDVAEAKAEYKGGVDQEGKEAEADFTPTEQAELARLHDQGIPVPGLLVRVDKHEARIWLEDLSVECASGILRERVARVVARGVECVSGLWGGGL